MGKKNFYLGTVSLLIALVVVLLCVKPSGSFLFSNTKGDCSGRTVFIYNALYKNKAGVDVVFFGSSRTMNGINDSLMNSKGNVTFLNLGYCRYGRNLDWFFIEEYCKTHRPKKIVLEVRATEGNNSHALTPFLLPVSDISDGGYLLDPDVFRNLYNKTLCNLKYVRSCIFDSKKEDIPRVEVNYGFWGRDKSLAAEELHSDSLAFLRNDHEHGKLNRNSAFYFEKLKELCSKNGTELYFLYFSAYGNLFKQPVQASEYLTYGKILLPPDSIGKTHLNFADNEHLNRRGAQQLSEWLSIRLKE